MVILRPPRLLLLAPGLILPADASRISPGFFRCFCKKTLTSQIYYWIKSVARLDLKAISPCFSAKCNHTHTAFLASQNCKTFRNKIDYLYRITTIFWSHIVYLRGESLSDNLDPPWYQVFIIYVNISELKVYWKLFCNLRFLKFIQFPSDLDRGPTTPHENLRGHSVTCFLNICQ